MLILTSSVVGESVKGNLDMCMVCTVFLFQLSNV